MIRMTQEAFEAHQARVKPVSAPRVPMSREEAMRQRAEKKAKGGGRNKYGAKATTVDGIEFDSKGEAQRYLQLKAMEKAGEITCLAIQVPFLLIPAQDKAGRKEREVVYVADFTYWKDGVYVVEDTKSAPTKTREYVIKRKLLLWVHGLAVREVLMSD